MREDAFTDDPMNAVGGHVVVEVPRLLYLAQYMCNQRIEPHVDITKGPLADAMYEAAGDFWDGTSTNMGRGPARGEPESAVTESVIQVLVHLHGELERYRPASQGLANLELPPSSTVQDLFAHLGLQLEHLMIVGINGQASARNVTLKDGDRVDLVTPMSGGQREPR